MKLSDILPGLAIVYFAVLGLQSGESSNESRYRMGLRDQACARSGDCRIYRNTGNTTVYWSTSSVVGDCQEPASGEAGEGR